MTFTLTRSDLDSISDAEVAFSTQRLLPTWDDIPGEFRTGNVYTRLAQAIFFGQSYPAGELVFNQGFEDDGAPAALNRCVRAHLNAFGPRHEHKIAGVGVMISVVCTFISEA